MKKITAILMALTISGLLLFATGNSIAQSANPDIKLNEIMYNPSPGNDEWIEIYNNGTDSINIDNYELTDEDGNTYTIPSALPDVPAGSFVVVIFDGEGSGSDDYDFSDNKAILHTSSGLINVFEDGGDQCSLYTGSTHDSTTIVDFVAWGVEPGTDGDNAYNARIWESGKYVGITKGAEVSQIEAEESIGLYPYPGSDTDSPHNWVHYAEEETTPGAENLVPKTNYFIPHDGGQIASNTFCLGWYVVMNAVEYRLQIDDDPNFGSPEVDITLSEPRYQSPTPFPAGVYYWRVKAIDYDGKESDWTRGIQIESVVLEEVRISSQKGTIKQATYSITGTVTDTDNNPVSGVTVKAERPGFSKSAVTAANGAYTISGLSPETYTVTPTKGNDEFNPSAWTVTIVDADVGGIDFVRTGKTLGIAHQFQAKDTKMLCLEGCREKGRYPWDDAHPDTGGDHGKMYCVQTSISMMASHYGGQISKDYISWHWRGKWKGDPSPDRDLAHKRGWPRPPAPDETHELSWALGVNVPVNVGRPAFANIKTWIENNRPIMSREPGHLRVIDGYRVQLGVDQIHLLDPAAGAKWIPYPDTTVHYWTGPVNAPNVVSDKDEDNDGIPDTMDDSDNDGYGANWGIVDFDERHRFPTKFDDKDSDDDCVLDKPDVRAYVFDKDGDYAKRSADCDSDTLRKEVDSDNDHHKNGPQGAMDGAEDTNGNGKYEPEKGETDPFDPSDDKFPTVESSGADGNKKDIFNESEDVYAYGSDYNAFIVNFPPPYDLYIVNDRTWTDNMSISPYVVKTSVDVDASGQITPDPTKIWESAVIGKYDIVVDVDKNERYNKCHDPLDDIDVGDAGFEVIPEFTTIAIPVAAILGLLFLFSRRKRKE